MTFSHVLLLDLDDVFLFSDGYRAGLRDAVDYFGRRLGYRDVQLSDHAIDMFEAHGLTSEWDSGTVCVALLLEQVWRRFPEYDGPSREVWPSPPPHNLPVPEFQSFAAGLPTPDGRGDTPLVEAEREFMRQSGPLPPKRRAIIRAMFENTRSIHRSRVHRVIQEFNLGSARFEELYGLRPSHMTESSRLGRDRPRLRESDRNLLKGWADGIGLRAVIFTNRPSHPPEGAFDTPEAELGVEASGLAGMPILGGGGLAWLSQQRGLGSGALLKPSEVHALAALRLALGDTLQASLETAAELALDGKMDEGWAPLANAHVHVFEDSVRGLISALQAVEVLRSRGVFLQVSLYGVSESVPKRAALAAAGAELFDDIQSALARVPGLEMMAS